MTVKQYITSICAKPSIVWYKEFDCLCSTPYEEFIKLYGKRKIGTRGEIFEEDNITNSEKYLRSIS